MADWAILEGDCVEQMRAMPEASVDAVVCDPPYNLSFMSRAWDRIDGEYVDPAFLHWFAGFVDGEGCFSVHRKVVNDCEVFDCQFSITLRADDRPILERIYRTLGMGTLSKPTAHRTGADNPKARYSISRKADCVRLRDLFRGFPLRAKKAHDMELWSDALDAWVEHEPGGGWDDVAEVRSLLMASRAYAEEGIRVDPFQMWCWRWGREAMRVLKPGGHCLAFGGTRTMHRLVAGLEDAGFEIRDTIAWMYGSGFPKSLDVGKAIDAAAGAERTSGEREWSGGQRRAGILGDNLGTQTRTIYDAPATPDAERWQGWGTALKPAHEPIVVARKPLAGNVAQNVLAHGTGALNVDGCRIGTDPGYSYPNGPKGNTGAGAAFDGKGMGRREEPVESNPLGRWPANVVLDPEAAAMLDEQTGELTSGKMQPTHTTAGANGRPSAYGADAAGGFTTMETYGDSGGASRFFYVAKASSAERNAGLDGFEAQDARTMDGGHYVSEGRTAPKVGGPRQNVHPTVKPIALMRWLIRLVTPPGGLVLDPFAGSGTTGCAAVLEGFRFVGIEREPEYAAIARARIAWWSDHPDGMELVDRLEAEKARKTVKDSGQLDIFSAGA